MTFIFALLFLFYNQIHGYPSYPTIFYFGHNENIELNLISIEKIIVTNDNRKSISNLESDDIQIRDDNFLNKRATHGFFQPDLNKDFLEKFESRMSNVQNIDKLQNSDCTTGLMKMLMDSVGREKRSADDDVKARIKRQDLTSGNNVIVGTFQAYVRDLAFPSLPGRQSAQNENVEQNSKE